ncbi:MAG: mechanosensitive ion channel family protein [Bacteroidota bacterium]
MPFHRFYHAFRTGALVLTVALAVALAVGCGADTETSPTDPAAVDSAAVADSVQAAATDAAQRSALAADSLAQADLDSMLASLDAPEEAASEEATPEPVADTMAVPVAADSANAAPPTDAQVAEQLAELRGQIEALTGVLGQSLAAREQDEAAAADTASVGERTLDKLEAARNTAGQLGWRVFLAFVVGITAFYLIRSLTFVLDTLAARTAERRLFYKRLIPIMRIGIWIFTAYIISRTIFELDGQDLIAAGAALGVAIGFAAQDALKNVFGGLIIVFDQPFQVGDKIAVGGTYGEVVEIGLRSTRIVTPDDNLVSVPNAQVADGQVSNANAGALDCQVVTDLYLPGWVDVHLAKQIAYEAAATSRYVYLDKPVVVICKDTFKETFLLHLKVKAYVLDTRYEFLLMSDVTEAAKAGFRKAGLLEPMPVRSYLVEPKAAGNGAGGGKNAGDGAAGDGAAPTPTPTPRSS